MPSPVQCPARTVLLLIAAVIIMDSCASAPVAPPPVGKPEQKPERESITWELSPARGYADEFGYVRLDFAPPGAGADLPLGGRLTVHLGRRSLDHANTIWYSFTVAEGATTLLRLSGREGIPNVKGPDGNWWNDIVLDVPAPFSDALSVAVQDGKTGRVYAFTLCRVVKYEESS